MTDKEKTTSEKPGSTFDFSCCGDWSKMKPAHMTGCDCAAMMSKMMAMCSGGQSETDKPEAPTTPDTTA
jgi:hypothetical protein